MVFIAAGRPIAGRTPSNRKKKKRENEEKKNHYISTFNVPSSIRFGGLES
jgi:hypothetical protein